MKITEQDRLQAIQDIHGFCKAEIVRRPFELKYHEAIIRLQDKILQVVNHLCGYRGPKLVMDQDGNIHEEKDGI